MNRNLKNILFLPLAFAFTFFISSCSKDEVEIERPEKVYYDNAQRRMKVNNYFGAIESLQRIETQYPFGKYAEQAKVELVYCYFMKGLSSYTRDAGLLVRVSNTDLSSRDVSGAKLAFSELTEFLTRFPDSQYAAYAKQRLIYLRNLVASNELAAADYYVTRKAYVAAIRRASYVLENIPNSNQNHRALQILKTSYEELGYTDLVEDTEKLIALNPPPPNSGKTNGSFLQNVPLPNSLPLIIGGTIISGATN